MVQIRTAVIPAAGLGTRVLPATKATPKEMLTVGDRPVIEHVVQEAFAAGVDHVVIVTGRQKAAMEDHFDIAYELEAELVAKNKTALAEDLAAARPEAGTLSFTRQQSPLGLGHAVWCARHLVGDAPFAVLLPDMLFRSTPGCLAQMAATYQGGGMVAVQEVPWEDVSRYGVADVGAASGPVRPMRGMVEKPKREDAPSNLFIAGRYILEPAIFELLETQPRGAGGEIQLTDAMVRMMSDAPFQAYVYDGEIFDCGSKVGWLDATLAYGLADPEYGRALRDRIAQRLANYR